MAAVVEQSVIWTPQEGPQEALVACPVFEVFFGGARGGGKTDGMLGDWMEHANTWGEGAIGVFFRRTFIQLGEVIARSDVLFKKLGAKWNGEKSQWTMPGGARLMFRHLDKDRDAENYQGHSYTRVYIEEATNFPSSAPIDRLKATLRSAIPGLKVGLRLTGNPGGPGHGWVKKRYIEPNPRGYTILTEDFVNPFDESIVSLERVFIPSRLIDNKRLLESQPTYIAQLQQTGSAQLVKAWLLGEWDVLDGAFFTEFDPAKHILDDEWIRRIPKHSYCFRAFDWGYAKPFSCGWYAVSDGTWGLPRGAILKYAEWYGCTGRPNEGLKLDAETVARGIRQREIELQDRYGVRTQVGYADPSIFARDNGPSIAETMVENGVVWSRADNKRIPGWQQVRQRLHGDDGRPQLYFLEQCQDSIRTIPLSQHDDKDVEDLDTDGEDHAVDELRYACMARPITIDAPVQKNIQYPRLPGQLTFEDMLNISRKRRLAAS